MSGMKIGLANNNPSRGFANKALAALLGVYVGIAAQTVLLETRKQKLDVVANPVFVNTGHGYDVSTCRQGILSSTSYLIPENRLQIVHDLDAEQRPVLVLHQSFLGRNTGQLHLRPGEKMPHYVSYGNGGALAAAYSKRYPCPDYQWRDGPNTAR